MPKLSAFNSTSRSAGPVGGRAATAADFGGDGGLTQLGSAVSDFSAQMKVREDKRAVTEARGSFADMKVLLMEESLERQDNSAVGAPGHFEKSREAFDARMAQFKENLTPVQRDALAVDMANTRVTSMTNALRFQAAESVRSDTINLHKTSLDIQGRIANGALSVSDGVKEYATNIATSNIPLRLRGSVAQTETPKFRTALTDGLLENTAVASEKLRSGELAKVLPFNELSKFTDALRSRISRDREIQSNDEKINLAASQPELWERYSKNKLTLLELNDFRGSIPQALYNTMHSRITNNRIPETTLRQKQDGITDTAAEFALLDIVNPRRGSGKEPTVGGSLTEVLAFQKRLNDRHAKGLLTTGHVLSYQKQLSTVIQGLMDKAGVGLFGKVGNFIGVEPNKLALGMDLVNDAAKKNSWAPSTRTAVTLNYHQLLEQEDIKSTRPKDVESEDAAALSKRLFDKAVMKQVRTEYPQVPEGINPNLILTTRKVVSGVSNAPQKKPGRVIPRNRGVFLDPVTKAHVIAQTDKDGKIIRGTERLLTPKEAEAYNVVPKTPEAAKKTPPKVSVTDKKESVDPDITSGEAGKGISLNMPSKKGNEKTASELLNERRPPVPDSLENGGSEQESFEHQGAPGESLSIPLDIPENEAPRQEYFEYQGAPGEGIRIPLDSAPSDQAVDMVIGTLLRNEGVIPIDALSPDVEVLEGGLRKDRKEDIVNRLGPMTTAAARRIAVEEDSEALGRGFSGFDELSASVQAALLDLSYNVGVNNVLSFDRIRAAVSEGDADRVLLETLDTAVVDGKTVKGLAGRRARMFNAANTNPDLTITAVEQLSKGTIQYLHDDVVIYQFKRPRHDDSTAGRVFAPDFTG
jgi:hypothetical protein